MTTIEREPTDVGTDEGEWRPIAHLAADPKPGERPTRGLCGAPLLGIRAEGDFECCQECEAVLEAMRRWRG